MTDWKESENRKVDQVKDRKWSKIKERKCKNNGDSQVSTILNGEILKFQEIAIAFIKL